MSELAKFKKEYLLMVSRMTDQVFQLIEWSIWKSFKEHG